jgi:hypothetical protein
MCVAALSCVAAMCCGATRVRAEPTTVARAHAAKKNVALTPWEQAEQGRDALEAIPEETRTQSDYTRVMDAYRAIYHADPADVHAAAAVNAVAELLAEQGRSLHDEKSLRAAVGQYEFLRTQYPASSLGVQALLAEGQIAQNDLKDAATARERYKLLLKEHARSEQAEEARAGLASLVQGTGNRDQGTGIRKDGTIGCGWNPRLSGETLRQAQRRQWGTHFRGGPTHSSNTTGKAGCNHGPWRCCNKWGDQRRAFNKERSLVAAGDGADFRGCRTHSSR